MRLGRLLDGGPLLLGHNSDRHVGVLGSITIDKDKVGRASAKITRNEIGDDLLRDIEDGIVTKASVGYMVHKVVLEKEDDETGATYRVMDWEPFEVSLVAVPADVSVGIGRGMDTKEKTDEETINNEGNTEMGNEKEKEVREVQSPAVKSEDILKGERERVSEISAIASKFTGRVAGIDELREKALREGVSIADFKGEVLLRIGDSKPVETPATELGLSEKETKEYSICRAVASMIPGGGVRADFEMECSRAIAKKIGKPAQGFYLPMEVQNHRRTDYKKVREERAVMVVGTPTLGGNLVGTVHDSASFIDIYINKMLAMQLGVQRLSGLVGDVTIPKKTAHGTAYWVTEGSAPTITNLTVGSITLQPKTVGAYSDVSRQLMLQALPAIDTLVLTDLAESVALQVDAAILNGSGSAGQPTGIINWPSLASVSDATFTWTKAIAHETAIKNANADRGSFAFLTTPSVAGTLKVREKASGYPVYLMENGQMAGYPVYDTLQMPSANLLLGSFQQVVLGEWGIVDVTVDPYTGSSTGNVRIVVFQSVDVGVRQIGAFHLGTSFS